jgi:hypothetical protein
MPHDAGTVISILRWHLIVTSVMATVLLLVIAAQTARGFAARAGRALRSRRALFGRVRTQHATSGRSPVSSA